MKSKLDFQRIANDALKSLPSFLAEWLPAGRREGPEYKALNPTRSDSKVGSFSINLASGAWGDFATGDKGGDAISLYAYLNGLTQLDAAKAIAERLGIRDESEPAQPRKRTEWVPIMPVPADAPAAPKAHVKRGRPEAVWTYRNAQGAVLGNIYRFRTSSGGKEILPCVFAQHESTRAHEWRWMAFPVPRPLFQLDELARKTNCPVLLVEGEKCARAASDVLRDDACVCTWPGGSKAVDKADWTPLAGRLVVIWPDCDSQPDKNGRLLPEAAQPGMAAAERIATLLLALQPPAKVKILAIPKPGEKPPGWDVADAIADGMSRAQILEFLRANQRLPTRNGGPTTVASASAGQDGEAWRMQLLWGKHGPIDCRENVIYLIRDHPEWRGVVGANTFAKKIIIRTPSPIGQVVGAEWNQDDDVQLALWLVERERILVRSPDTVRQAVQHVAKLNSFHPVRDHFDALVWDGVKRVDGWPSRFLGTPDTPYTRAVGRYFLVNIPRRIYEPGCIMRSVPVLEGAQDKGKSTALRLLAEPWFSDTPFRLSDKDVYQQIQGVLVYEIAELESFNKAEASAIKAFISSTEDNFRAPYERQNERHKRQGIFCASVNGSEYLKDWTGNTRFWPLPCDGYIDLDGIALVHDQLLAEALLLYRAGARTYPTTEEQSELFRPEQERRMITHPWFDIVTEALASDPIFKYQRSITVRQVLSEILKVDMAKLNPQGSEAQRVGQILHKLDWVKRHPTGNENSRIWVWERPATPAAVIDASDPIPF